MVLGFLDQLIVGVVIALAGLAQLQGAAWATAVRRGAGGVLAMLAKFLGSPKRRPGPAS